MFTEVGKKLQVIAQILFWVITATSVVLAFVFGFDEGYYRTYFNAELFFPLLLGGPIVAYIGSLILHGFGSIVSRNEF